MAVRPISTKGWRTVVRGGLVKWAMVKSLKPATESCSGTRRPRRVAACMIEAATVSFQA